MNIGDRVLIECVIVGLSNMAYTQEGVVDLSVINIESNLPYTMPSHSFTVYEADVVEKS